MCINLKEKENRKKYHDIDKATVFFYYLRN